MLLCFPINSMISFLRQRSPISSRCSISKLTMRSSPGCEMETMRPFWICLRRSIQNPGAVIGLCLFLSVRYISGREALADKTSRYCPAEVLTVSKSSSDSGCAILESLPPMSVSFNSIVTAAMVIPSNAMGASFCDC